MGWFEGLLQGFNAERGRVSEQNYNLALLHNQQEGQLYTHLLNSPDPEIRAKAATGLISTAAGPQRKGGLRGWLGEMESSPILDQMRTLMQTPVTHTETTPAELPSRNITGQIGTPPGASLAQTSAQTTTPGTQGPRSVVPDVSLSVGPLSTPQPTTRTVSEPRHAFPTMEEEMAQRYRGEYSGEIEGIAQSLFAADPNPNRQQALKDAYAAARQHMMGRLGVGGIGAVHSSPGFDAQGNIVQGRLDSIPGSPTYGQWLNSAGQVIPDFVATSTMSTVPRGDRQSITLEVAREYGVSPNALTPAMRAEVDRRVAAFGGEKAGASATGRQTALATAPLTRQEHTQTIGQLTTRWNANQAPIRQMQQQATLIQTALARMQTDPNGAGQAILTAFGNILDPRSGAAASEYNRPEVGQPLLDRVQALWNRWGTTGGQGMTPENLRELATTAQALVGSMSPWTQQFRTQIENEGRAAQLTEDEIQGIFGEPPGGGGTQPSSAVGTRPPGAGGADDFTPTLVNGKLVWTKKQG